MQKRLVQVGTSLALVIDKAVLQMWNVTRMSRLSVEMEGRRLVITPVAANGDPRTPSRRDALEVVHELRQLGLKQAHFDRLAPTPMRLGTYVKRLDSPGELEADVMVMMCRMEELRRLLRDGWNQRHAFSTAISAHPYEGPSGVETRITDGEGLGQAADEAVDAVARDYALAEIELARQEAQFEEQEREDQRLAQEARDQVS